MTRAVPAGELDFIAFQLSLLTISTSGTGFLVRASRWEALSR